MDLYRATTIFLLFVIVLSTSIIASNTQEILNTLKNDYIITK